MSRKITYISLLSVLAIIFGYIESLFPIPIPIPGIKLGISNIVILFSVYNLKKSDSFLIMLIKVTLTSLLFAGLNTLFYSLLGGVFSIIAMNTAKKLPFSIIGVSVLGALFHNLGQIVAASLLLKTTSVFYYLPALLISGAVVGIIIGILGKLVFSKLKYSHL